MQTILFIKPTWRYWKTSFLTRSLNGNVGNNVFGLKMSLLRNGDIFALYLIITAVIISGFKTRYFCCESHNLAIEKLWNWDEWALLYWPVVHPWGANQGLILLLNLTKFLTNLLSFADCHRNCQRCESMRPIYIHTTACWLGGGILIRANKYCLY